MLLLPKPMRTSFWTRNTSSLVQRDDEIAPTESRPYSAWMRLNSLGGVLKRLIPRDFAPRIFDPLPDHRLQNAVLMGGVAVGEAAFDAGMALVGLAGLVGDHAQNLVALQLSLEGAADAAIGAGRHDRPLRRSLFDDRLLVQRRRRACLNAGAAGDAFGRQKIDPAGRDVRIETAAEDRQREGALHFLAGANAARADDAFRRLEGEIGVGRVGRRLQVIGAVVAVADFAQAHDSRPGSATRNRRWRCR